MGKFLRYVAAVLYFAIFFAAMLWISAYVVPLDYADEPTRPANLRPY